MTELASEGGRNGSAARLARWLERPVDVAWLAAFRIVFGLTAFVGVVRFLSYGWVEKLFVTPRFHFRYWGFEWVEVLPAWAMHSLAAVLGVLALLVAFGLFYRPAIVLFFVGFTYVELIDATTYLNHYYLVSLLALLLCFLPAHCCFSLDARFRPRVRRSTVPAFALYLLRGQIGLVYLYAGIAKLGGDWLLHAQPLSIWLGARTDTVPVIGTFFGEPFMAYAMSWAGFLFDTTIPLWLSLRKTRLYAYAAVIGFHTLTGMLFPIGMFPFIMVVSALVFFPADWPRRVIEFASRLGRSSSGGAFASAVDLAPFGPSRLRRIGLGVAGTYLAIQALLPMRHRLYGGDVLWHEQGMRFSWKVMVREKNASVTYLVRLPESGRTLHVPPRRYLTAAQEREMSAQPDLVLQLAHHVADDFRNRGHGPVEVRADVVASLNGRRAARLVDPNVNLARVHDGLGRADWILPAPEEPPLRLTGGERARVAAKGVAR